MAFTGNEDCEVSVSTASTLNKNFRDLYPAQIKGIYFSQKTLRKVLDQTECVGIRFYFGADPDGMLTITFAGVKANEDDIIGVVGDNGIKCPPHCGSKNTLNS